MIQRTDHEELRKAILDTLDQSNSEVEAHVKDFEQKFPRSHLALSARATVTDDRQLVCTWDVRQRSAIAGFSFFKCAPVQLVQDGGTKPKVRTRMDDAELTGPQLAFSFDGRLMTQDEANMAAQAREEARRKKNRDKLLSIQDRIRRAARAQRLLDSAARTDVGSGFEGALEDL